MLQSPATLEQLLALDAPEEGLREELREAGYRSDARREFHRDAVRLFLWW